MIIITYKRANFLSAIEDANFIQELGKIGLSYNAYL